MNDNRISPHKDGTAAASAYIAQKMVSGAHPDAALISAGKTFDALVEALKCANRAWIPNSDAFWEASRELIKAKEAGTLETIRSLDLYEVVCRRADQISPPPAGFHTDDITSLLEPVEREILARPAHTVAGLAIKCRVAKFAIPSAWDDEKPVADLDWDQWVMRTFVESIMAYIAQRAS